MRTLMTIVISALFIHGCRAGKGAADEQQPQTDSTEASSETNDNNQESDTASDSEAWWEFESDSDDTDSNDDIDDSDDSDDKEDDSDDKEDEDFTEDLKDCAEEFDPELPCEGDWTETICLYDGLIWWCEGGVWLNEEDKEE